MVSLRLLEWRHNYLAAIKQLRVESQQNHETLTKQFETPQERDGTIFQKYCQAKAIQIKVTE